MVALEDDDECLMTCLAVLIGLLTNGQIDHDIYWVLLCTCTARTG